MSKDIYVYDIEVYSHDWMVVARQPEGSEYVVIHNDNHALREFLTTKDLLLAGFNSKHYDDGIIHAMSYGADNAIVKNMNDFIINEKGRWWEYPFVQFKKKMFESFDLRDDLPMNLSLKAIEGNMGRPIVETSIPFDIDRKLTDAEVAEVISYCMVDVDNTIELYHERKSYLDGKKQVARIKGIDEYDAIKMTNAKLTAKFLDADRQARDDEFDYPIPDTVKLEKYSEVMDFFRDPLGYTLKAYGGALENAKTDRQKRSIQKKIDKLEESGDVYECKLTTKISGVTHTYAWGGIHGAISKYMDQADDEYNIVTIDVASYYPSMMLEYDYISRNIPSAKGYADIYHTRMKAKGSGDKLTSNALKLVLNTAYGAMKNQYNDLYDPRNANAICVGGQVLLTDLIEKLEKVDGYVLIQSNTDGLVIKYARSDESRLFDIVSEWEKRTRMNMEYTDVLGIAQKDVNNYVMKIGEVYLIKDGVKQIESENKGYINTKGGYVSLYGGGDFRNNSISVIHEALVKHFMDGIPVEDTIRNETDVTKFQIIAKTGSTYSGTYHEVGDEKVEVQKVNRVYATTNKKYGTLKKTKANGRADKIASLPDNVIIDNNGIMTISDMDHEYYIEVARERIRDYVGKRNENNVLKIMNIKMEDTKMSETKKAVNKLNIYEKINKIRLEFASMNIKKNGMNRFAEYKYFELEDIVPAIHALNDTFNVTTLVAFTSEEATLMLHDNDSGDSHSFTSPMATQAMSKGATEVQNLGAVQTYIRRYLYMMYLDIVENDSADATTGKPEVKTPEKTTVKTVPTKSNRPASTVERKEAKDKLIDSDGEASETQIKSIKNGLKKLREKGSSEEYIKQTVLTIRGGIDKTQAEELLIEIAGKVKE